MATKGKKNTVKAQGNPEIYVSALYGGEVLKNTRVRLHISQTDHPQVTLAELGQYYGSDVKVNY